MKKNVFKELFRSTFYISAFTFGGGFVIVPLMRKRFVEDLKWIDEKEMLNMVAVAQSSPGAIAVNTAILIGFKVAGIFGAAFTILGTVTPPFIILSVISFFYSSFRDNAVIGALLGGMQAGVAAVIAEVVTAMGANIIREKKIFSTILMVLAFSAVYFLKVNVIYIILICGLLGALAAVCRKSKEKREAQK